MSLGIDGVLEKRNRVSATDKTLLLNVSDSRADKSGVSENRFCLWGQIFNS
jgi:hypothetical protein